jgi:DNA replication protein DnaC
MAEWLRLDTHGDHQLEQMVCECGAFANAFRSGESPRWMSILGNTGTGKTHCAKRLWKYMSARLDWSRTQFVAREIYWPEFVSDLRSGQAYDQQRDMMKWPVLFLDDIGAERDTTGFASEQLNTLLGCRVDRWTIITSNLLLNQIGQSEKRIADRIIRAPNVFVELNTKSHSLR